MNSEIKTYQYPDGEKQRVHVVRWDDWSRLDFLQLKHNEAALECFRDIYKNYLVPGCPWVFGNMILFQIPIKLNVDLKIKSLKYGVVKDVLTAATVILQNGIRIIGGKPIFLNAKAKELWEELEEKNCVYIVCGKLPFTKVIPIGKYAGFLSKTELDATLKVNASFFIMDSFDCATVFDHVGKIFGLCVKDGAVISPPLYNREALLVKQDGSILLKELDVRDLKIEIQGKKYCHGVNSQIYTRPENKKSPKDNRQKLVVIGNEIVAVKKQGSVSIPASGYVMSVDNTIDIQPGERIVYHGLEDIKFGLQVGNSIMRNGVKTKNFISKFYNIRKLEKIPFPPSLYPMDYEKSRAARIALGSDKEGKPMLFWAEGAGKLGYNPKEDSCGATLSEMAEIAADLGMINGINLDGGGSAQILLNGKRFLRISDRNKEDNSDAECLIPLGLIVK